VWVNNARKYIWNIGLAVYKQRSFCGTFIAHLILASRRIPSFSFPAVASRLQDNPSAAESVWRRQPPPSKRADARGSDPSARQKALSIRSGSPSAHAAPLGFDTLPFLAEFRAFLLKLLLQE
jgi:hypothetical protein